MSGKRCIKIKLHLCAVTTIHRERERIEKNIEKYRKIYRRQRATVASVSLGACAFYIHFNDLTCPRSITTEPAEPNLLAHAPSGAVVDSRLSASRRLGLSGCRKLQLSAHGHWQSPTTGRNCAVGLPVFRHPRSFYTIQFGFSMGPREFFCPLSGFLGFPSCLSFGCTCVDGRAGKQR